MSTDDRGTPTRHGAVTDSGGRRAVNEDAVLARHPVFCVADGMGGHTHGEMASAAVVHAFDELAQRLEGRTGVETSAEQVQQTVARAQARIRSELGLDAPEPDEEMTAGSTVAGVVLTHADGRLCWLAFNIGDSRIYRSSGGAFTQISVDHSVVQELIDAGEIDDERARSHPLRNLITRAVGSGLEVAPDFWLLTATPGDRVLLCSDGLINELGDDAIAAVLRASDPPERVASSLVEHATRTGARDNVSVVVVELPVDTEVDEVTAPRLAGAYDPEDTMPREYAR